MSSCGLVKQAASGSLGSQPPMEPQKPMDHQSMATLDVTQLWIIREPQLSWTMTLDIEDH